MKELGFRKILWMGNKAVVAKPSLIASLALAVALAVCPAAGQQIGSDLSIAGTSGQAAPKPASPTSLAELVKEAQENNPQVIAARRSWQAATQAPSQASALPDPQVVLQQFAVGSPRPFAGFSNSDFAYVGVGVSQDLPYPGKLRLKGEMASRDADSARHGYEGARRSVVEQLKASYFQLSYVQQTLEILDRDEKVVEEIEKIAEARYRVGQGNQQDVLKAQLERTKLVREVEVRRQEVEILEAQLKQILNRPPVSPDLVATPMVETNLPYSSDELLTMVRTQDPEVASEQERVRRQGLQVELAHKDFYPDFNVQYMWQHTAEQFRDYYLLSFGVKIPIWRSRRQRPELAQATEELNVSRREYEAQVQQAYFEIKDQFIRAETASRLLKIYREGLIPQATATFDAGLAAYQTGREDFQTLHDSFLDVLNLDIEYWSTLADHETALAQLERLTGVSLP